MNAPEQNHQPDSKNLLLPLEAFEASSAVLKALASPDRLRIIHLLGGGSLNVKQIAAQLALPISTAAAHIRVLEEAGVLMSESVPGQHGAMKLCSRRLDHVGIRLAEDPKADAHVLVLHMPIGAYSRVIDIQPTCGLVSAAVPIGEYDNPGCFYYPQRLEAQLLWFRQGYVEYRFGGPNLRTMRIHSLEFSFEACSEAYMHRNPWKSDVSLFINDRPAGMWTSPADLGGRRGLHNPSWWPSTMTQYGYLVTWRVDEHGCFVNNMQVSTATIDQFQLSQQPCILIRLGVDPQAVNKGGLNLFGDSFGDFAQGLVLRIGYEFVE